MMMLADILGHPPMIVCMLKQHVNIHSSKHYVRILTYLSVSTSPFLLPTVVQIHAAKVS